MDISCEIKLDCFTVRSLSSCASGFESLYGIEAKSELCPFCGCKHISLPIEEVIAVGFGNTMLTRHNVHAAFDR